MNNELFVKEIKYLWYESNADNDVEWCNFKFCIDGIDGSVLSIPEYNDPDIMIDDETEHIALLNDEGMMLLVDTEVLQFDVVTDDKFVGLISKEQYLEIHNHIDKI